MTPLLMEPADDEYFCLLGKSVFGRLASGNCVWAKVFLDEKVSGDTIEAKLFSGKWAGMDQTILPC